MSHSRRSNRRLSDPAAPRRPARPVADWPLGTDVLNESFRTPEDLNESFKTSRPAPPGQAPVARVTDSANSQRPPSTIQPVTDRRPLRTRSSVTAGRITAWRSRHAGLGQGGVIGGRVTLALDPKALRALGRDRTVVLVTGTNGKTTTALMITQALEALAEVAANSDGANMPDGVLAALAASPEAPYAVLEVDETYLPWVAEQLEPAVLVLLNLSRDQLDRVGEVRSTERDLRAAIAGHPGTTIVANCDDVLVTSAATAAAKPPLWVGTGRRWTGDSTACPRCDGLIEHAKEHWSCACGL